MPGNIFISYRREDTSASAVAICQYLERAFGRSSVFIDVDMRAGSKFPEILDHRLAECRVLLALIGPKWLDARDEAGNRRLDDPNDWVRLEIARALKRDITVIPVCVEGGTLPKKATLPGDIQGVTDHQSVTVTTTGFRNEMAGLARDIRAISNGPWHLIRIVAAVVVLLLVGTGIAFYSTLRSPSMGPYDQRRAEPTPPIPGAVPRPARTTSNGTAMTWPEAVAPLAAGKTLAETCVALLKRYGTVVQIANGQLTYTKAKSDADAVIAGLVTALHTGDSPIDLPSLQSRLTSSLLGLEQFCNSVKSILPAVSSTGEKGLADALTKIQESTGPIIKAAADGVAALYNNHRNDIALTRKSIEVDLEAAKWPDFATVKKAE
jgi:hypothetical protein